ncbi:hepatocellular carcinoma-associated antigen 59-domain-containing protein [Hypoxylon trugodes]|uniref:hepatocellular carcinoma-associated antigen 59-domain-containing protein n=1 Tax=Hypoxylon trugodes TaxID=326681 RepID=UPI002190B314|nr:hepatocellular carcinoma-associated antigen 59-domain-containing protein [Hypoxylon trugodes]KAI1383341.1 hepatocellular carcinoma-associated antigen 59-domain-containing protein [Hypoxylon trugodes]
MDGATPEATPAPHVVFRGKKRKTYRQRTESTGDDDEISKSVQTPQSEQAATTSDSTPRLDVASPIQSEDATEEEKGLSVAEVLRLRNARKARLGGVKFGAGASNALSDATTAAAAAEIGEGLDDLSLMIREEENKALDVAAGVKKRFAPQTGLAADAVNKHMEEYIEAELAKRHSAIASSSSTSRSAAQGRSSNQKEDGQQLQSRFNSSFESTATSSSSTAPRPEPLYNRALQGQLMEIDLGDEARSRNEARTERATRRMHGEAVEDDDEEQQGNHNRPPKKVRLGRDGKPWRPRNRRNSDDIRRDQLVEEILRENRLDVYEPTPPPRASSAAADGANGGAADADGAADERIAEEFRREFMDAMAERQQKRKKPTNAPSGGPGGAGASGKGAKDEDVLKGPKLGGSRNARAAMRNLLLEKAKEAKKPGR